MSCETGFFLYAHAISAAPVARSIGAMNQLFARAYQVHIPASRVVCLSLSVPVGFTALPSLLQRRRRRRNKSRPVARAAQGKASRRVKRGRTWKIITNLKSTLCNGAVVRTVLLDGQYSLLMAPISDWHEWNEAPRPRLGSPSVTHAANSWRTSQPRASAHSPGPHAVCRRCGRSPLKRRAPDGAVWVRRVRASVASG